MIFNRIQNGVTNLWIRSLGDAQSRQLTFDAEGTGFASWSPDGKQLAVGIKRGEDNYVGVMSSTGGSVTQLNFEHGFSAPSSWSSDGDKIVFASNRNGNWNIYWISLNTRQQEQLTDYKKANILLRYPAWSPLGNQIAYEYGETTGNIWLMELR